MLRQKGSTPGNAQHAAAMPCLTANDHMATGFAVVWVVHVVVRFMARRLERHSYT